MKQTMGRRILSVMLSVCLLASVIVMPAQAANKTFYLPQAQKMALSTSSDLSKKYNEILLKQMKYVEAVKGIQAKVKNLTSFRWTPLLSFKFPESLTLSEDYELYAKPLTLQAEIDVLRHELADLEYEVTADVNNKFVEIYILQEKISYTTEMLSDAQDQLSRNQASLIIGQATQEDVDRSQANVTAMTTELSDLKRDFETQKGKLSDMVGVDVSSGYTFSNPLKQADIPRSALTNLVNYTLANDQNYYYIKMTESTAKLNLDTYESLMKSQYGSKMNYISGYINMARRGMDVDYAAFQLSYASMLTAMDAPWSGSIRILFFRFTKEWFKGEISGTRYIEDEMYAIYTACMEYSTAVTDREQAEKDLTEQVEDSYESLVTAWKSYETLVGLEATEEATLTKLNALNQQGLATYLEVQDQQEIYQTAQIDTLDALADYNTQLNDFDRLTCGAVTKYLEGIGTDFDAGSGGDAYVTLDPIYDPYYYIYTSVADLTFHIGISIPDDFETPVDAFEIWYDGVQIGERTNVGDELRHLALDYGATTTLIIRLYDGEDYVCEEEVDASVPRDVLNIPGSVIVVEEPRLIGSYTVSTEKLDSLSLSELTLSIDAAEGASTYTLTYGEGGNVYTSTPQSVNDSFSYLTLLIVSIDEVALDLYASDGSLIETAYFDSSDQSIYVAP